MWYKQTFKELSTVPLGTKFQYTLIWELAAVNKTHAEKIFLKLELKPLHRGIKRKCIWRKGSWGPWFSSATFDPVFSKHFLWAQHLPGNVKDRKGGSGGEQCQWPHNISLFIQRSQSETWKGPLTPCLSRFHILSVTKTCQFERGIFFEVKIFYLHAYLNTSFPQLNTYCDNRIQLLSPSQLVTCEIFCFGVYIHRKTSL